MSGSPPPAQGTVEEVRAAVNQGQIAPPPTILRETGDGDSVSQPSDIQSSKEIQSGRDLDKDIDVVLQENVNRGHLDADTSVTIDNLPMDTTLSSQAGQTEAEDHEHVLRPIDSFDFMEVEPERGAQRQDIPDGSEQSFTSTSDSSVLARRVVEHVIHKVSLMMPAKADDPIAEPENEVKIEVSKVDKVEEADTDVDVDGSQGKNDQTDVETVSSHTETDLQITEIESEESPSIKSPEGDVKVGLFQYYSNENEPSRGSPEVTEFDDEGENDIVEDQVESITDAERENILQLYGLGDDLVVVEPGLRRKDSTPDSDGNSLNAHKGDGQEKVLDVQRDVYLPQTRLFSVTRDLSSAESSPRVDYVMTPSDHQKSLSPVDHFPANMETPDPADKNWPDRIDDDEHTGTLPGQSHTDGVDKTRHDEDVLCGTPAQVSVDQSPAIVQYEPVKENGKFRIVKMPMDGGGSAYTTIRVGGEQSPQQESPRELRSQGSEYNGSKSQGSGSESEPAGREVENGSSKDMEVNVGIMNGGGDHIPGENASIVTEKEQGSVTGTELDKDIDMANVGAEYFDKDIAEMKPRDNDVRHTSHSYNANGERYDVNMEVSYASRDRQTDSIMGQHPPYSHHTPEHLINGYIVNDEDITQSAEPQHDTIPQTLSLSELRASPVDRGVSGEPINYSVTDNTGHESMRTGPLPYSVPDPLSLEHPVSELRYRTERLGQSLQHMEREVSGLIPLAYEEELIQSAYDRVYKQTGQLVPRLSRSTGSQSHDADATIGHSRSYDSVPIPATTKPYETGSFPAATQSFDSRRIHGVSASSDTGPIPGAMRSYDTRSYDTGPIPGYKTLQEQQARWSATFDMLEDQHRHELESQYDKHKQNIQRMQQQMEQELQRQHLTIRRKLDIHKGALIGMSPERDSGLHDMVTRERDSAAHREMVTRERDVLRHEMLPPERDSAAHLEMVTCERDIERLEPERDSSLHKQLSPGQDIAHKTPLSPERRSAHDEIRSLEQDIAHLERMSLERDSARHERMSPERDASDRRIYASPKDRPEPAPERIPRSPDTRSPARGHRIPDRSRSAERSHSQRGRSGERSYHGRRSSSERSLSSTTRDLEPSGSPDLPFTESKSWREIYQEVRAEEEENDTPPAPPLDAELDRDQHRSRPHQSPIRSEDLRHSPDIVQDTITTRDGRQSPAPRHIVSPLPLGDDVASLSMDPVPTSDTVSPHVQELLDTLQEGRSSLRGIQGQGSQTEGQARTDMPRAGVYSSPMPMLRGKGSKAEKTSKRSLDLSTSHDSTRHFDSSTAHHDSAHQFDSSYMDHSSLSVSQDRSGRHRSGEKRSRDSHRHDASNSSASLRMSLREKHSKHLADLRSYYEDELRELRAALSDSMGVVSGVGRGETTLGARAVVETPLLEAENRHLREKCDAHEDEVEDQYQRIQELEQKNVGIEKRASEYSAAFAETQALGIQNRAHIEELQRCLRDRDDLVNDLEAKLQTQQDNAKIYKKSLDEKMELHRHDKISLQRIIDKYESMDREHKLLQDTMNSTENKLYDTRSEVVELTRTISKLELENKRLGRENDNLHHKVTQSLNLSTLHESFGSPSSPRGLVEKRSIRPASPITAHPSVAPTSDTRIASFTAAAPRDPPAKDHGPAPSRHSRSVGTDTSQTGRSKTSTTKSSGPPAVKSSGLAKEKKDIKSKKPSDPRDSTKGHHSSKDAGSSRENVSQRSRSHQSERELSRDRVATRDVTPSRDRVATRDVTPSRDRVATRDVTPPRPLHSDSPPALESSDFSPLIKAERELYKLRDMMRQAVAVKPASSPPQEPKLQTKFYGSERPTSKDDYTPDLGSSRGKREKPTPSSHSSVAKTKPNQSKSDRNEKSSRKPSSKTDRNSKSKDKTGADRKERDKGREREKETETSRHRDSSRHRDRTPTRPDRDRTPTRTDKDAPKFSVNPDEYKSPTRFDILINEDSKSKSLTVTQKAAGTQSAKLKDLFPSEAEKRSEYSSYDQHSRSHDHSRSLDQHSRSHDQHSWSHDNHSKSHDQPVKTHDQGTETVEATMDRVRAGGYMTRPQWEDVHTSMVKPAADYQHKVPSMTMEDKIKERLRSISDMEQKYDGLQAEKRQLESSITKIPLHGRVDRNNRRQKEQLEDRLDNVDKELGSLRMSLKRCNVLKTSG